MSSEISRVMIFSGFGNQTLRMIDSPSKTPIRDIGKRIILSYAWKRSSNPVERFAIESIEELGFNDMFQTKLCQHLNRSVPFNLLREQNRPLSEQEAKKMMQLIKQTRAGITSRRKHTSRALDVIIPIAKAFFSHKSSVIVAIGLFVKRLVEHVDKMRPHPPALKPLLQRSERKLAEDLRKVLDKGSYCASKSKKGAEILVDQFIASKLIDFCHEPISA